MNLNNLSLYFFGLGGVGLYYMAPKTLEYWVPEKGRDLSKGNQLDQDF